MTKYIYGIIVLSLFLFGCQKSFEDINISDINNNRLLMPDECEKIGIIHNEGLEAYFEDIREIYAVKTKSGEPIAKLSKSRLLALAEKSVGEFCSTNIDGYTSESFSKFNYSATRSASNGQSDVILPYLQKIKIALKKTPASPDELLYKLNIINEEARLNLSEIDAIAVYAGTSTCYNSYIYWKKNYIKWYIAFNKPSLLAEYSDAEMNEFKVIDGEIVKPTKKQTRGWWDDAWSSVGETWDGVSDSTSDWWNHGGGKQVVGADAGGAVAGAMGGAIAGSAAGGVGAGPGAIAGGLGGGVYESIDTAISEWIQGL